MTLDAGLGTPPSASQCVKSFVCDCQRLCLNYHKIITMKNQNFRRAVTIINQMEAGRERKRERERRKWHTCIMERRRTELNWERSEGCGPYTKLFLFSHCSSAAGKVQRAHRRLRMAPWHTGEQQRQRERGRGREGATQSEAHLKHSGLAGCLAPECRWLTQICQMPHDSPQGSSGH